MKRCVLCDGSLKKTLTKYTRSFGSHRIAIDLPATACTKCGEDYVSGEVLLRADLLTASALPGAGIATGEAFKFMRKALGLRAADLAEMLSVDAATISRWETGKGPVDRAALATLAAAATERLAGGEATLGRLRALGEGRGGRLVRIEFAD